MSSPSVSPLASYKTKTFSLPLYLSENERVTFSEVVTFIEPRLPLAMVHYSLDGVRQPLALRIDFGKQVFLDHLTDTELDAQVSPKARNIVTYLGKMHAERAATH